MSMSRCQVGNTISGGIEKFFRWLGYQIGKKPLYFMIASVVLAGALGGGFANWRTESRGDKLWVPSNTEAQKDKKVVDASFQAFARFEEMLLVGCQEQQNLLTPSLLDFSLELHFEIINLNGTAEDGTVVDYQSLCLKTGPVCFANNVLAVFDYNPQNWSNEEKILATLNSYNDTRVILESVLGGLQFNNDGQIVGAQSLSFQYFMQNNEVLKGGMLTDMKAELWEDLFLERLESETEQTDCSLSTSQQNVQVIRFTFKSFADEFGGTIEGDVAGLQIAIITIMVYSSVMLSRWSKGCVGLRFGTTLMGIISIGLAILASWGLCFAFGLFYSPLMSVLPFLLLGVGVDDMFVLVNEFDNTDEDLPIEDRVSESLAIAGSSITITSLTDFFAFVIGSNTTLPALRVFSIFAAFGILFDYIFQITFFLSCLVLATKWSRGSFCASIYGRMGKGCREDCKGPDSWIKIAMQYIAHSLTISYVKAVVVLITALLLSFGIYGVTQIEVNADINNFIPPGSYLKDWNGARNSYYTSVGEDVSIYIQNAPYTDTKIWDFMDTLTQTFRQNQYVETTTVTSWFEDFRTTYNNTLTTTNFYSLLDMYLSGPGTRYAEDVKFLDPEDVQKGIKINRITGYYKKVEKSLQKVKGMTSLREEVGKLSKPVHDEDVFVYGSAFLEYEQYKSIGREVLLNIGLALLMVAVVVSLLLADVVGSILTFCSITAVVLELIGYMHFWDFDVDSVTVIFWVICLGLSVDYSVHVAHAFLNSVGTPNERIKTALQNTGVAVFNGALSTFIAVLCLAPSQSYVFLTFFRSLFLCVVLGVFHGMVVLPVLLSLINPQAKDHVIERENSKANMNSVVIRESQMIQR